MVRIFPAYLWRLREKVHHHSSEFRVLSAALLACLLVLCTKDLKSAQKFWVWVGRNYRNLFVAVVAVLTCFIVDYFRVLSLLCSPAFSCCAPKIWILPRSFEPGFVEIMENLCGELLGEYKYEELFNQPRIRVFRSFRCPASLPSCAVSQRFEIWTEILSLGS